MDDPGYNGISALSFNSGMKFRYEELDENGNWERGSSSLWNKAAAADETNFPCAPHGFAGVTTSTRVAEQAACVRRPSNLNGEPCPIHKLCRGSRTSSGARETLCSPKLNPAVLRDARYCLGGGRTPLSTYAVYQGTETLDKLLINFHLI